MCLNCGCGQPDERHGNEANIVTADLRRASEANGQDFPQTVSNLQESLATLATSFPTSGRGSAWPAGSAPQTRDDPQFGSNR